MRIFIFGHSFLAKWYFFSNFGAHCAININTFRVEWCLSEGCAVTIHVSGNSEAMEQ